MKRIKKLVAAAMCSTLILSSLALAGCGSKSTSTKGENGEVTVNIFQFKVEVAKELEQAAQEYSKENKNVKINIETVGGGADYGAALRTKIQSGKEPAIFNIGGPQDIQDWKSRLVDLSKESWVKNSVDGVLDGVTEDGKVYGTPFSIEGYGLIYNKAIFKDAGVDASKINTYTALEQAVKTLDSKIKSGALKEKYPKLEAVFEMPAKETWITGLHTSNAVLGQEFTSTRDAYKAKKVEFKHKDGFKSLIDLQANYSKNSQDKSKLNAVDYSTQVGQGLAIERVAIIQQGNWIYNEVQKVDEKVANNLDILPIPVKGGKEDSISIGVPMYWAVNNKVSKEEQQAAKDFLKWLYTSEKGKDFVVNKLLFIPPFKGYDNLKPKDCLAAAVEKYIKNKKTTPWVFMGYPTGWGMESVGKEVQKYLSGQATWDDVIKASQAKWESDRNK
ncbi:ABC transporter substrate-binding protein [Clostridium sp. Marseille-Q2269]|uniref:ABC transporter substrate-binding protein n=1 Tax=Clostridium sp. Marseille-Q2269 TaxID=2942205 RepID=UPI0020739E05|nr:ABC transporter substrate-binding protein [Clostridium sp. Marseille-Q2269]